MGLAMSAMMCEDAGDEFAGIGPAPEHYNAVFGRPHEGKWVAVMDKGVIKVFGRWHGHMGNRSHQRHS